MILKIKIFSKELKNCTFVPCDRSQHVTRSIAHQVFTLCFVSRHVAIDRKSCTIDRTLLDDRSHITDDRQHQLSKRPLLSNQCPLSAEYFRCYLRSIASYHAINRNSSGDRSHRRNFASVPFPLYVRSIASFRAIDLTMLSSVFL